jgi:ABC-type sugar transport system substrate-binding protein
MRPFKKKGVTMRKITVLLALLVALLAATTMAAAKSYQFTGVVKTVQGDTFTVQKSPTETWEFSKDAATKGSVAVGDKVTVHYRMVATTIEPSAATKK